MSEQWRKYKLIASRLNRWDITKKTAFQGISNTRLPFLPFLLRRRLKLNLLPGLILHGNRGPLPSEILIQRLNQKSEYRPLHVVARFSVGPTSTTSYRSPLLCWAHVDAKAQSSRNPARIIIPKRAQLEYPMEVSRSPYRPIEPFLEDIMAIFK